PCGTALRQIASASLQSVITVGAVGAVREQILVLGVSDEQKAKQDGQRLLVDGVERCLVEVPIASRRKTKRKRGDGLVIHAIAKALSQSGRVVMRRLKDLGKRAAGLKRVRRKEKRDVSGAIAWD